MSSVNVVAAAAAPVAATAAEGVPPIWPSPRLGAPRLLLIRVWFGRELRVLQDHDLDRFITIISDL